MVRHKHSHVQQSINHFPARSDVWSRSPGVAICNELRSWEFAIPLLTHVITTTRYVTGRVSPTRFSGTPRHRNGFR